MQRSRYFRIDWVLIDQLAIGPAPRAERHLDRLREEEIRCILSLCTPDEATPPPGLDKRFRTSRCVLPDHRAGRLPTPDELKTALGHLAELQQHGPVFVHCVAAMERSPLVCLAWLVRQHRMTPERALDYLMQQHPGTNPLPGQLKLIQGLHQELLTQIKR
ncbi:MAG: dual specificity protein phosphatase [Cyanobacteriota bacterium]|nr:dual specificity protein phosphatase [Cyanobacteriota bacterium]